MKFISKFFNKKEEPKFDIEKTVGEYLLNLPRCNKFVVIVSPKYGENNYRCEIIISAADLAPWAEQHSSDVWSSNQNEQAARKALPIWLRGAKTEDKSACYIPQFMYEVVRPYVLNFVNDQTANIYCLECQSFVDDIHMEELNRKSAGDWSHWTDVWTCPKGHQLYYEEHDLHINRRR